VGSGNTRNTKSLGTNCFRGRETAGALLEITGRGPGKGRRLSKGASRQGARKRDDYPRALLHLRQSECINHPWRCFSCGISALLTGPAPLPIAPPAPSPPGGSFQVIGNKWVTYLELLHDGHSESESFAELGLKRYCAFARHTRFLRASSPRCARPPVRAAAARGYPAYSLWTWPTPLLTLLCV
jgi:DNA-directed RNA polymerase subunit N (RpoN/RPB10)